MRWVIFSVEMGKSTNQYGMTLKKLLSFQSLSKCETHASSLHCMLINGSGSGGLQIIWTNHTRRYCFESNLCNLIVYSICSKLHESYHPHEASPSKQRIGFKLVVICVLTYSYFWLSNVHYTHTRQFTNYSKLPAYTNFHSKSKGSYLILL